MKEIRITENEADQRVDRFVKKFLSEAPLGLIYKYLRTKKIKVNGKKAKQNYRLQIGDQIQFLLDVNIEEFQTDQEIEHYEREFGICFEDQHLLIVDKPSGLLVHSNRKGSQNTLNQQVLSYLVKTGSYDPKVEKTFVPAPSNRLDRNTTGIVLFGKDYRTQQGLNEMIREQMVAKFYLTLVHGNVEKDQELQGFLYKDQEKNQVQVLDTEREGSLPIHTRYRVQKRWRKYTLLEVELITGRSHQIRAHLSSIGHPIVGDPKYGDFRVRLPKEWGLSSQFLHAKQIVFNRTIDPLKYLEGKVISAPLPDNLKRILKHL